jgi:hypothetical protein
MIVYRQKRHETAEIDPTFYFKRSCEQFTFENGLKFTVLAPLYAIGSG